MGLSYYLFCIIKTQGVDPFPLHTFLKVHNVELVSSSRNQDLRQMTRKEILTPCGCSVMSSSL